MRLLESQSPRSPRSSLIHDKLFLLLFKVLGRYQQHFLQNNAFTLGYSLLKEEEGDDDGDDEKENCLLYCLLGAVSLCA